MADIFSEVDEDIRREQYARLWRTYRWYVLGGALAIIVGVGAWLWWDNARTRAAEDSGARFMAALALATDGDHEAAAAALAALAADGAGDYPVLARFREAAEITAIDRAAGIRAYDALAANTGIEALLRDLARVFAGYAAVDIETYQQVWTRVSPVSVEGNAWRVPALEVLALSAFANGMAAETRIHTSAILADPNARNEIYQRAQILAELVDASPPTTTMAALAPAAPPPAAAPDAPLPGIDTGAESSLPFDFGTSGGLLPLGGSTPGGPAINPFSNRFGLPGLSLPGTEAASPAGDAAEAPPEPASIPAGAAGDEAAAGAADADPAGEPDTGAPAPLAAPAVGDAAPDPVPAGNDGAAGAP